jgi:hypothetical protein
VKKLIEFDIPYCEEYDQVITKLKKDQIKQITTKLQKKIWRKGDGEAGIYRNWLDHLNHLEPEVV